MIERDQRSVGLGLDVDFPLAAIGALERVAVTRREYRVTVDDDLAILFFDREELVARAFAQRFRRFVGLMGMCWLGRKWKRGDDRHSGLDAGLTERRKEPDLVYGINSDPVSNVAQKSFGSLDHALAFEV